MVSVDVLERLVPRVANATVDLDRPVRGIAREPVRPIVTHGDLIADLHMVLVIELPRRLADEIAYEFGFGVKLGKRPLDRLPCAQGLPKGNALIGILHGFVDTELRNAQARCRLPDSVLMNERVRQVKAVTFL